MDMSTCSADIRQFSRSGIVTEATEAAELTTPYPRAGLVFYDPIRNNIVLFGGLSDL
jgi:hypothetical protein